MHLHVLPQGAGVRVGLVAHLAQVRLVRRVHVHVLLAVAAVGEAPVAALELALEGLLPCVRPFVDLEVLRPGEDLPAAGEGAGEGLLARVHADVVDQFVLGLEGLALAGTLLPVADVVALLGPPDVLHRDVGDQLVHGAESFIATFFGVAQLLGVDPLADQLLLDALLPHVAEKGTGVVVVVGRHVHAHVHIHGAVLVVQLRRRVGVSPGAGDLAVLLGAGEHLPGQPQPHLPVEDVLRGVRAVLLVDAGEQEVALSVRVRVVQAAGRRPEDAVLPAARRRLPEAAAAKQEVPGGVEGRPRVRADVRGVRPQRGRGVAGRLRGERRALPRGQLVGSGVQLEGAHVRRVHEAVLRRQAQLPLLHLGRGRVVVPGEGAHAERRELRAGVQQHGRAAPRRAAPPLRSAAPPPARRGAAAAAAAARAASPRQPRRPRLRPHGRAAAAAGAGAGARAAQSPKVVTEGGAPPPHPPTPQPLPPLGSGTRSSRETQGAGPGWGGRAGGWGDAELKSCTEMGMDTEGNAGEGRGGRRTPHGAGLLRCAASRGGVPGALRSRSVL